MKKTLVRALNLRKVDLNGFMHFFLLLFMSFLQNVERSYTKNFEEHNRLKLTGGNEIIATGLTASLPQRYG